MDSVKRSRGRPVTIDDSVPVGIRLQKKFVDIIDKYAKAHALTRSEVIRRLVVSAIKAKTK
jgi:metal-responsive CopG/Arc/MetJ family transcriptional regulator